MVDKPGSPTSSVEIVLVNGRRVPVGVGERQALEQLASSRTAQARLVERARILLAIADGRRPGQVAREPGRLPAHRLHLDPSLQRPGAPRPARIGPAPGRPPTYTAEQRAEVIAAALTDPKDLGLPFGCWTLDRLQAYLNEQKGIPIKRSRIDEILVAEGLRWRHQETWFGERVDPDFAEKRGPSSGSTPPRRRARSSSASTRWGRSRPRASPARSPSAPSPEASADGSRRPAGRAKQEVDYGRRGKGLHLRRLPPGDRRGVDPPLRRAAARPTGPTSSSRSRRGSRPEVGRVYAIVDNLQAHRATDVLLFCLAHPRWEFVFQPKYAAYLNLIEPWWKVLRVAGAEGAAVRDLGGGLPGGGGGDGLLERAPAPVRLGPAAASSAATPARDRGRPRRQTTCRMNH